MTIQNRRRPATDALEARIAELEAIIARRSMSSAFGCLTRSAVEDELTSRDLAGMALVYFDVDNMKTHNAVRGKTGVNLAIAYAIKTRGDDIIIGQWFSGDEFIALVPVDDALGYAQRVQARFADANMSATFVIKTIPDDANVLELAQAADDLATNIKNAGVRAVIVWA